MTSVGDECRLVGAGGAIRLWGQVGCICFDEQSIEGELTCDISKRVVFFVGEHAGEADVEPHVDIFDGVFEGCAEGVHDTSDRAIVKLVF